MVPNLGAASFLKDPEPLQMELQHSRCAVESESLGGFRTLSNSGTFMMLDRRDLSGDAGGIILLNL